MNTQSSGHKTAVDHGVQIRFIDNIGDGGRHPAPQPRNKPPSSSKYGVAVRVQGIAGQPYVVLKDGQKGDSYGVQLRTDYGPDYRSLPRRTVKPGLGVEETYGETGEGGGQGGVLRRAQSHGSLLDRDGVPAIEDFELSRPPGDGKSGSYGNLDGGIGVRGNNEETWAASGREGPVERRMWGGSYQATNLSRSQESLRDSQLNPYPPQKVHEFQVNQRQSAFSRLKNRFDGGAPASQQSGLPPVLQPPRATSPYTSQSPYTSPPSSTNSSLGRNQGSVVASRSSSQWSSKERLQVDLPDTRATPDLLLDQVQSAEMSSEEEQLMKNLYSILKQGSNERDVVIRQKVEAIYLNLQSLKPKESPHEEWMRAKRELETKVAELQTALQEERRESARNSDPALKGELESCLDENLHLQELLSRKNTELNETQSELTQLRMDRDGAEKHIRDMEDQLAELQEELRRENGSKTQDLMSCQTQLMEVCQLKQKLEDALRQRERELTALKGALKDEVASHDREMEALRQQYGADMEKLRSNMEQVSQSQAGIEAERLRVNTSVRSLQKQLEDCRDESSHWMEQFHATRDELRSAKQEELPSHPEPQLLQTRLEKDELEDELKELKDKLSMMKQQTPDPKHTEILSQELQRSSGDLQKVKSELEKQRVNFDKKVMEVISLKKSHQNQEAELRYEIDRLKEQLQRAKEDIAKAQEKNKKLPNPATVSDLEQKLGEAQREASRLKEKLSETEQELETIKSHLNRAQADVDSLRETQSDQEATNSRLKEKLSRLEAQLQSSAAESSEAELSLHAEMRGLRSELDEAKRRLSKLNQERQELSLRLENSERDKEALKQTVSQLEDTKSQLGKALDKLNKDYESLKLSSKEEVHALSAQLEEQRERARKEMQDAQRHGKDAQSELEKHHANLKRLEEEMLRQKKELQLACEERDNHQLDKELLSNRLRHLEGELEASKNSHNEKAREVRILEDKLKCMELECEEEKSTVEMLTERVSRSRDQIDQLRSELMQERSSKQDLELDKNGMERQLKELRSRVAEMEGQSRSSAGVSQLENKIQELEERLRFEEREKNSVLASQRRSERKLKELNMTLDEERHAHTEQRDQLALKVKALKRQVDESETELERIEGLRRKAQRDMEEQMELKESLQARVTALETELKRKTQAAMRQALDSSALSSDDDDSLYDHSTITSILTEGNLQTSSC
ncbi:cingulin isoform X1 [Oryzias latipes]